MGKSVLDRGDKTDGRVELANFTKVGRKYQRGRNKGNITRLGKVSAENKN